MNYFCTFFDARYMTRGMALYRSLLLQGAPFHLWIMCMDEPSASNIALRNLPQVTVLTLDQVEQTDHRLTAAKSDRSLIDFYFSSKPFLCRHIFAAHPEVDLLTYLDADFFFFGSPAVILNEMKRYSVGLTGHRFPPRLKDNERLGIFNAGFISFRRDEDGLSCLAWWADRCLEWCHDFVEDGRYADQGYLNDIPRKFKNVVILRHKGINAAPWNIAQYMIAWDGRGTTIDGDPLILYHFHGMKQIGPHCYDTGFAVYQSIPVKTIRDHIYAPYISILLEEEKANAMPSSRPITRKGKVKYGLLNRIFPSLWRLLFFTKTVINGLSYRSIIFLWKR